jgi:hypothetical protein
MTAHFPRPIFAVIRYPMKVLFMPPRRACLSLLRGVFEPSAPDAWIGPRFADVWGLPKKKGLRTANTEERARIAARAETIYTKLKGME